jgi:hypothetical protein
MLSSVRAEAKKQPPGKTSVSTYSEERLHERVHAREPLRARGRLEDVLLEHGRGRVDRGELEALLRAEELEHAALAHPDRVGEARQRQPAEAFDRRQARGLAEDRGPASLAVAPAPGSLVHT